MSRRLIPIAIVALFLACGGTESDDADAAPADSMAPMASDPTMTVPAWMTIDASARTVTMEIEAGQTDANNGWNFNGYVNGNATITVPTGYTVTIEFSNGDVLAHSIGVNARVGDFPPMFENPEPVFEGAISSNATSITNATLPGASETITFSASRAGTYSLVCFIPAHATAGMWVRFVVSDGGTAGVTTQGDQSS